MNALQGRRPLRPARLCLLLLCLTPLFANDQPFLVGRGMADITGTAAEVGMMGYVSTEQKVSGIHLRLFSRAFIVVDPATDKRVVFVSADQAMIFQSIQQGVLAELAGRFNGIYHVGNVILSATHTHAAPGGASHYAAPNLTTYGFIEQNYRAAVDGIVRSIERAHHDLKPGNIYVNQGDVLGGGVNRSADAYQRNPAEERARYDGDTDKNMVLLRFEQEGFPVAALNWFAVHPVSMNSSNPLISGDNKGYAAYRFERAMGNSYRNNNNFISAFAQTNSGDITPNLNLDGTGPTNDEFDNTEIIGERQFETAWDLFHAAENPIGSGVDYRQTHVDMSRVTVDGAFTGAGQQQTCAASFGYAMAAGTEDGRGPVDWFYEGQLEGNIFIDALTGMLARPDEALCSCQAPKPILLATGITNPYPWTPDVLPISIHRIGRLAIVAMPTEITTMAGRRVRETVQHALAGLVDTVVIAALSGAYANYCVTPEEYEAQNYEGGSTLFGKWTLPAYQQELAKLAVAMRGGQAVPAGPTPRDLSEAQLTFQTGVVLDNTPIFKDFGDVDKQPNRRYRTGETVEAHFWTGHPKNNLNSEAGFFEVQRKQNGSWVTLYTDADWDTVYRWKRKDAVWGTSLAKCYLTVTNTTPRGSYRIVHHGHYKNGWNGRIYSFSGTSRTFEIE
ncbi:neutral/alkaline ceramidase [Acanthopleuribacter pedis]|uniref:Neutral ceramidase n=1 Tax=Acanthopleuribacter pedis TaxID=442870 RepID=A0A8J7U6B1_9BACT|nr:neutral/alkaline ceramidase [Acanthopleuribacter pedis]MBO1323433.1 neutral/alkaline ceramidase [Acanthopleuribacter pedis]